MIKDILNDNDIIASMTNQIMGRIATFYVAAGGMDPVGVDIFARDRERALALIDVFNKSIPEE